MKRELWCANCASKPIRNIKVEDWEPKEGQTRVKGKARQTCLCDMCGVSLSVDDECTAVSFFIEGQYFKWESEFIK
jgi:hypothetical protein